MKDREKRRKANEVRRELNYYAMKLRNFERYAAEERQRLQKQYDKISNELKKIEEPT